LDKNVVGGLFTYLDDNNEIDIEFSKWGQSTADNSQYVVQPDYHAGNTHRFNTQLNGDYSTHCIDWHQNYIKFFSLHGHYYTPPDSGYIIDESEYTGVDIPTTSTEKVHLNLWLMNGNPPSEGQSAEMVVKEFKFIPQEETRALYVWADRVVKNGETKYWNPYYLYYPENETLFSFAETHGIKILYLATPGLYDQKEYYASFIQKAHDGGIKVHALSGDKSWATNHEAALNFVDDILNLNFESF